MNAVDQAAAWPVSDNVAILYFLVEETGGIRQKLYELEENPDWAPLFANTNWAPYIERSPLLVRASRQGPFAQWFQGEQRNHTVRGLVIESEAGMDTVTEWARALLQARFGKSRHGLLRYYDPLIWHRLAPAEHDQDNPITRVHYWHQPPWQTTGEWLTNKHPHLFKLQEHHLTPEQTDALVDLELELQSWKKAQTQLGEQKGREQAAFNGTDQQARQNTREVSHG